MTKVNTNNTSNFDIDKRLKELGFGRTKSLSVGKQMGSFVWFHRSYADTLLSEAQIEALHIMETQIRADVVRVNLKTDEVCAIECLDFDSMPEPLILRQISSKNPNTIKATKSNHLIYHSKWMFVADDYPNFCVLESKLRSIEWKSQLGVDKSISSRIGRSNFWNHWLSQNSLPPNSTDR